MDLGDGLAYITNAAVRAVMVRDNPLLGAEHSAKAIYEPFETLIPYSSLTR